MIRGTQVMYIPPHMRRDKDKPASKENCVVDITNPENWKQYNGIRPGFVTGNNSSFCFVRYWLVWPGNWSYPDQLELRTKNNSEPTPKDSLVQFDSVSAQKVAEALWSYCENPFASTNFSTKKMRE